MRKSLTAFVAMVFVALFTTLFSTAAFAAETHPAPAARTPWEARDVGERGAVGRRNAARLGRRRLAVGGATACLTAADCQPPTANRSAAPPPSSMRKPHRARATPGKGAPTCHDPLLLT